jgi:Flp pilus assembly protein TadG
MPFLAILVFGVVDFGRAYSTQSTLTNMAREGAAYLAFNPTSVSGCTTSGDAASSAQAEAPSQSATIVITDVTTNTVLSGCPASPAPSAGDQIKVTVSTTFTLITPVGASFAGGSTRTLTGTATAVIQG